MPTKVLSIGTTATLALQKSEGYIVDFILENLSANNVYFGDHGEITAANATRIIPSANLTKDNWAESIYLIADGALSDVRLTYQIKPAAIYERHGQVIVRGRGDC